MSVAAPCDVSTSRVGLRLRLSPSHPVPRARPARRSPGGRI